MAEIQICRTCLEVIRKPAMYVPLEGSSTKSNEIRSKLESCVPEMTISAVKSPVICGRCLISLNASYEFKRKCVATETEIYKYLFDSEDDVLDLKSIANNCSVEKPLYTEIKLKSAGITTVKIESDDEICLSPNIKKENYCDFEATENFLSFNDSYHYYSDESLKSHLPEEAVINADKDNSETVPTDAIPTDAIPTHPIPTDPIPSDPIPSDPMPTGPIPSDPIPSDPIPNSAIVLTRILDTNVSESNVEVGPDSDHQKDLPKTSPKRKRGRKERKKRKRSNWTKYDDCCVYYPYNSTTAEPLTIKKRPKLHGNEKNYCCGLCGYYSSAKLDNHIRMHTGEKPFKCKVCEYTSAYPAQLIQHMKKHETTQIQRCAYCEFRTDSLLELKDHMENHPGYKMYKCNKCEYSADVLKHVKYHKLTHTNKLIYECATCQFKTANKHFLKQHVGIHFAEKPFKCNKCLFATAYRQSYHNHLKTHRA